MVVSGICSCARPKKNAVCYDDSRYSFTLQEKSTAKITEYKGTSNEVVLPDYVNANGTYFKITEISENAFNNNLKAITISKNITKIEPGLFANCPYLAKIKVARKNKTYDSRNACNAVVATKSNMLVAGCMNTVFPKSITEIGPAAFKGCMFLTCAVIPSGITKIGKGAFANCPLLAQIKVDSKNKTYDSRNECNAVIETKTKTLIQGCVNTEIPVDVCKIGPCSFMGCTTLKSIVIPGGVCEIGDAAFKDCLDLRCIVLPSTLKKIDASAFSGCHFLENIYCKGTESAFADIDNCDSFLPHANKIFSSKAAQVTFATSEKCQYLKTDTNDAILYKWLDKSSSCVDLTRELSGLALTTISGKAFKDCNMLQNITLPSGVECIGEDAFSSCKKLIKADLPSSLKKIGKNAFKGCLMLKDALIPKDVEYIESGAFKGCDGMMKIKVDAENPTYDSRGDCNCIIETCDNLIIQGTPASQIPDSATGIASYAFAGFSKIGRAHV